MTRSVRSYQREIKMLRDLLHDVRWVQPTYNGSPSCSGCGQQQHMHAEECALSRVLDATPGPKGAR